MGIRRVHEFILPPIELFLFLIKSQFSFHGKGLTVETVYEVEDSVWEAVVQFQAGVSVAL